MTTTIVEQIALGMGLAWASGINLYAAILTLGLLASTGQIDLPPGLDLLANPLVIAAAGIMYVIEFFADKTPGIDMGWDAIQTFVRIPAGAVLAAQAMGQVSPEATLAATLIGGTLAAGTHATKAGTRMLINTSPEPVSNWMASLTEDVAVIAGLWAALHYPIAFLCALAVMVVIMAWALPHLWRAIKHLLRRVIGFFRSKPGHTPSQAPEHSA
jgi:hypothetical protein